jgi:hypothetical protein
MAALDDAIPPPEHGLLRPGAADAAETERLVSDGLLRHVVAGVYAPADGADSAAVRAAAIMLALTGTAGARRAVAPTADPAAAVLGHATAVWLHAGGPAPARVDVVIAPGSTRLRSAVLRLHEHRLAVDEVDRVGALLVTSPIRTAADVARTLAPPTVLRHLDALNQACAVSAVDVLAQLERMPHGRGVARARSAVHAWATAVASRPAGP